MNVKLKRESRLLIMAITSVALFVHIVVICAAIVQERLLPIKNLFGIMVNVLLLIPCLDLFLQ